MKIFKKYRNLKFLTVDKENFIVYNSIVIKSIFKERKTNDNEAKIN